MASINRAPGGKWKPSRRYRPYYKPPDPAPGPKPLLSSLMALNIKAKRHARPLFITPIIIQPKTYTYASSLLQTSKWDRIKDSWLATAKVWLAPPEEESDSLILLVTGLVEDARISQIEWLTAPPRKQQLLRLTAMLEKPALCFVLLNDRSGLLPRLIDSLSTHRPPQGVFSAELTSLETNLLTTIACFRFCRTLYELSEQVHVARWQPWLEFTLPDLAPFVPDCYMSVADHLSQLALSGAQVLRELTTYVLRGSHALVFIAELAVLERVGLLLHVVACREAHQELLEALQGLLSAMCVTVRGTEIVVAAAAGARWKRALCRVPVAQEAWVVGWGLLHYAFEVGLTADLPAGGDEREKKVADAKGLARPCETLEVATVHTCVYGAVLCESLGTLHDAAAQFTALDVVRVQLGARPPYEKRIRILQDLARVMSALAAMCAWQYGREAVYIAGRHSGSVDYVARIARHIGSEFGRRWARQDCNLYNNARLIDMDMVTMGRAFEPLMTAHPDNDMRLMPLILLLNDVHARLTSQRAQIRMLCDPVDNPNQLLNPEYVSHFETVINSMTARSMHSAQYVKELFELSVKTHLRLSFPAILVLALNEAVKASYIAASIIPPPPNYVPGSSSGLKVRKPPVPDMPLYARSPVIYRDVTSRRRTIINNRAAVLRIVCSLTTLLRRTAKYLYGNTDAGFTGVMNLGDRVHSISDTVLESTVPAPPSDPVTSWPDFFGGTTLPPHTTTVNDDPLAQWTIARAIIEALVNTHSLGGDKKSLLNTPLIALTQRLSARSLALLTEPTAADPAKQKYLGRNTVFYLSTHVTADTLAKHHITALADNLALLRELHPGVALDPRLQRLHDAFKPGGDGAWVPVPLMSIAEWIQDLVGCVVVKAAPKPRPLPGEAQEVGWRSRLAMAERYPHRNLVEPPWVDEKRVKVEEVGWRWLVGVTADGKKERRLLRPTWAQAVQSVEEEKEKVVVAEAEEQMQRGLLRPQMVEVVRLVEVCPQGKGGGEGGARKGEEERYWGGSDSGEERDWVENYGRVERDW